MTHDGLIESINRRNPLCADEYTQAFLGGLLDLTRGRVINAVQPNS